jgi:aralkylamine N-acetyltransferase
MPPRYKFITDPDPTEALQIMALYQMADWWGPEDEERSDLVRRLILGSHCFLAVVEDDTIVGMGRAISDGVNDAYIQDVTVTPHLRHQGVGTCIVETIVQRLHQDGLRWIGLIAADHSHDFYKRLGFMAMPYSTPMLLKETEKS